MPTYNAEQNAKFFHKFVIKRFPYRHTTPKT